MSTPVAKPESVYKMIEKVLCDATASGYSPLGKDYCPYCDRGPEIKDQWWEDGNTGFTYPCGSGTWNGGGGDIGSRADTHQSEECLQSSISLARVVYDRLKNKHFFERIELNKEISHLKPFLGLFELQKEADGLKLVIRSAKGWWTIGRVDKNGEYDVLARGRSRVWALRAWEEKGKPTENKPVDVSSA